MTETFLPPLGTRWCPACDGEGELHFADTSVNPFSGVGSFDPQCDFTDRCPRCGGAGTVPDVAAVPLLPAATAAGRPPGSLLPPEGVQPPLSITRAVQRRSTDKQRPRPVRATRRAA